MDRWEDPFPKWGIARRQWFPDYNTIDGDDDDLLELIERAQVSLVGAFAPWPTKKEVVGYGADWKPKVNPTVAFFSTWNMDARYLTTSKEGALPSYQAEARDFAALLRRHPAVQSVELGGGGHWKVRSHDGTLIYTFPSTPSDRRWKRNALADLRREGIDPVDAVMAREEDRKARLERALTRTTLPNIRRVTIDESEKARIDETARKALNSLPRKKHSPERMALIRRYVEVQRMAEDAYAQAAEAGLSRDVFTRKLFAAAEREGMPWKNWQAARESFRGLIQGSPAKVQFVRTEKALDRFEKIIPIALAHLDSPVALKTVELEDDSADDSVGVVVVDEEDSLGPETGYGAEIAAAKQEMETLEKGVRVGKNYQPEPEYEEELPSLSPTVTIALNVEIPAQWTEEEIRQRLAAITQLLRSTA